jgi:hypothetical protein
MPDAPANFESRVRALCADVDDAVRSLDDPRHCSKTIEQDAIGQLVRCQQLIIDVRSVAISALKAGDRHAVARFTTISSVLHTAHRRIHTTLLVVRSRLDRVETRLRWPA